VHLGTDSRDRARALGEEEFDSYEIRWIMRSRPSASSGTRAKPFLAARAGLSRWVKAVTRAIGRGDARASCG